MSTEAKRSLILAAGRGSRMKAATADKPKCLVELAGCTLLDWQLDALDAGGAGAACLVGGYLAEKLEGRGPEVVLNPRWEETNMVRSLQCAAPLLHEAPTVVGYADIVYHPDCVAALRRTPGDVVLCADLDWQSLWSLRFEDPLEDAETFLHEDRRLTEIGGRPRGFHQIMAQYMGLIKLTPKGFAAVEEALAGLEPGAVDRLDVTALLRLMLARGQEIRLVFTHGRWCETDSESDLAAYCAALEAADRGRPWSHDWRFTRKPGQGRR